MDTVRVRTTKLCEPRPVSWPILASHGRCSRGQFWPTAALLLQRFGAFIFVSSVPYPPYSERVYILHRGYFLAIASRTFVFFFARFSTPPLVCLASSPRINFVPRVCVCVLPLSARCFQFFRREFTTAAECRTLHLRGPALLRFQSLSVAPFLFHEIPWAFFSHVS